MKRLQHFFLIGTLLCISWMSFMLCQTQSQGGLLIYPNGQIEVQTWDKRLTAEEVFQGLHQLAQTEELNLYKVDYRSQMPLRISVAEAIGDEKTKIKDWGETKELSLFHATEPLTQLKNMRDTSPASSYSFNDTSKLTKVIEGFAALGLKAKPIPPTTSEDIFYLFAYEQLLLPTAILFMGLILLFYYEVVQRYKEFAVKKLHGIYTRRLLWQFIIEKGRQFLIAYLLVTFIVFVSLYFYNSWQQVRFFIGLYITASLLFVVLYSCLLLSVVLFFNSINIRLLLKNHRPLRAIQIINNSAKFVYISLFLIVTTISLQTLNYTQSELARLDRWTHTKEWVTALQRNDGSIGTGVAENDSIYSTGNAFKRNMPAFNDAGGVLVSADEKIKLTSTNINQTVLAVNANYFKHNQLCFVNPTDNKKLERLRGNQLLVLVPQQFESQEEAIRHFFLEWFEFQKYVATDIYNEDHQLPPVKKVPLTVMINYIKANQTFFTYDVDAANPLVKNPIIIVLHKDNVDADYYDAKSSDNMLMPATFIEDHLKKETALKNIIVGSEPLYTQIQKKLSRLQHTLFINTLLVAMLMLICSVLTLASAALYCDNYKQKHFIMFTHGHSLWRRHRNYLTINGSFILVLLVCALFKGSTILIGLVGFVGACDSISILIALYLSEKRTRMTVLKGE